MDRPFQRIRWHRECDVFRRPRHSGPPLDVARSFHCAPFPAVTCWTPNKRIPAAICRLADDRATTDDPRADFYGSERRSGCRRSKRRLLFLAAHNGHWTEDNFRAENVGAGLHIRRPRYFQETAIRFPGNRNKRNYSHAGPNVRLNNRNFRPGKSNLSRYLSAKYQLNLPIVDAKIK